MFIKQGSEAIVEKLQAELEIAERELRWLLNDRLMDKNPAVTMTEPPKNEADVTLVEAEIDGIKAEISKNTWTD